jgi:hypothetical protein
LESIKVRCTGTTTNSAQNLDGFAAQRHNLRLAFEMAFER